MTMEKLGFALEVDDGWPPVASEHVWCDRVGHVYTLRSPPLFIKGLACGDRFVATPDPVNGLVFEFDVVDVSGHSLVWVLALQGLSLASFLPEWHTLGCNTVSLAAFDLTAIDIPATAPAQDVCAGVDRLEAQGFSLAFPVWRHEAEAG